MIPIHQFKEAELNSIRAACAYLFTPELAENNEFLKNLNPVSVKKAFREKAKKYHPDLYSHESGEMLHRRQERFLKIRESYSHLNGLVLDIAATPGEKAAGRGTIIAVGGAKGGTGKSIFAVNLAVLLAGRGKKTVVVDLDLGSSSTHLYLGIMNLKGTINDFLTLPESKLADIAVHTKYGPLLIGGDSSKLGAANITFTQKLRLLNAIKKFDADYTVLDLGGDTTYNILDFFLAAEHGIVVTTCDPASYLKAYNFIKVALYRKLNRIFGPESEYHEIKDPGLKDLIQAFTLSLNGTKGSTIPDFLALVKEKHPRHLSFIRQAIDSYRPCLVVNEVTDQCNVAEVVERIKVVSEKMLSLNVDHIGSLPHQQEIEASARELVPVVVRHPFGMAARRTRMIANRLTRR
jgi:flagellar biosynthesis protein FlhG